MEGGWTRLLRKTVPVSSASTNRSNAACDASFVAASVHTDAVSPYGESFMSARASSSEETCGGGVSGGRERGKRGGACLLDADDGPEGFFLSCDRDAAV